MNELKPCPFCMGEAELCYMPALWGYALYVSCKGCDAKSPRNWQEKEPKLGDTEWKVAADQWNHRPGEAVETCGKAYCEHNPEGLPVCSECREASTLAHDIACAKLADARADADHWKGECNALQRMVHEARASLALEAKDLRDQISDLNAENIELKKCLAEIEEREAACCPEDVAFDEQIVALRKLVEQMRGALSILGRIWFYGDFKPETPNEKHLSVMMKEMGFKYESENEVLAALEAAERGE